MKSLVVGLLCLRTPVAALRARGVEVKAVLEEALSNLTGGSADWDKVYLQSLLHLSTYMETAGQPSTASASAMQRKRKDWPHFIHQTAKDPDHLNPIFEASRASWTSTLPSWDYHLWTDAEMEDFMQTNYPWFMPTWQAYPRQITRVDAVRYFWMHHFGGIYADMDFFALKDVSGLLAQHADSEVLVGQLGNGAHFGPYDANFTLEIAFMISKPKAALWDHITRMLPLYLHVHCSYGDGSDQLSESTRQLMAHPGVTQLERSIGQRVDAFRQQHGFALVPQCSSSEGNRVTPLVVTGPNFFSEGTKDALEGVSVVAPGIFYPIDYTTAEGKAAEARMLNIAKNNIEDLVPAMQREFPDAVTGTIYLDALVGVTPRAAPAAGTTSSNLG